MATLTDTTVVAHPDTLQAVQLNKGDTLPEWAVGLVGDHILDEPAISEPPPGRAPGQEPPRGGAGSGAAEWAAYAAELGVAVAQGATRDSIIEQLVALELINPTQPV